MSIEKIIIRIKNPHTNKRQLFISSKKLHQILGCDISYKTFIETNVIWSRLRENIDYHFNQEFDTFNLSICAVQAILIIEPYRVCRRVNILRDYPDDKIKIYP
ncbi:hypothetical protein C3F34_10425 [Acinetobacter sp. ACNIH2]|nr:hypothetical protein C3F34_10425 [Acinetobacter sp. ACNIH2]